MLNKFEKLKKYLTELKKQGLCLAFSGGIDSIVLLSLCKEFAERFVAITLKSDFQSDDEINLTKKLCEKYNVKQIIVEYDILSNPIIVKNPKDRCYHCKKIMFLKVTEIARLNNLKYIIDGTNFDDLQQYRPGLKALSELNIISPFTKFEITKSEIREFARTNGIEFYNKPSTPCLATRLPYNEKITTEKLDIIKKAEDFLKSKGFESCRFRLHNNIARIEIPPENFSEFINKKAELIKYFKRLKVEYITLDIEGFRSGSMG